MIRRLIIKWRILIQALPYAVAVLVIKLALFYFSFEGIIELQEVRIILTAGVFLMGFMLAGTLADYKESERIPGDIAITLEAIEEICITMATKTGGNILDIQKRTLQLGKSTYAWFVEQVSNEEIYQELTEFNDIVQDLDQRGGAPPIIGRLLIQLHDLRKLITRARVFSETGFILAGYALLELLIVTVSILLLVSHFNTMLSEILIIFFVELIYVYMYILIRDIDDPFEYTEGHDGGNAEVTLFPIRDYMQRLEERIEQEEKKLGLGKVVNS